MTRCARDSAEEYRRALEQLTPEQFATFRERWGGAKATVEECVRELVYASPAVRPQWEETIVYRLGELGISGLKTESDKSSELARASAAADAMTAQASQRAADAAESSADSAATAVRVAWFSVVVALLAIIVSLVLARCWK